MAYNQPQTDWIAKEKRDAYMRVMISGFINDKDGKQTDEKAQEIVLRAFELYPDGYEEEKKKEVGKIRKWVKSQASEEESGEYNENLKVEQEKEQLKTLDIKDL